MRKILLVAFFIVINYCCYSQIYVSVSGSGNGSGSSWTNASTLQNAITNASANSQIWIEQGIYIISSTLICSPQNVSIYGGFIGNETTLEQRDWENNSTTFDGQGSVKILRFGSADGIIDGINFINGYVTGLVNENNDGGGALRLSANNQIVRNCSFVDNVSSAERGGGAILIWHGNSQIIENCTFINNSQTLSGNSNGGGAIHSWNKNVVIRNCQFTNNNSVISGGAIYTWGENLIIEGCIFENNQSESDGGAIHNNYYDSNIYNSIFKGNLAGGKGGAISNGRILKVVNCLFDDNSTNIMGGAISNNRELYVTNSTFVSSNNTAISYLSYNYVITNVFNSIFYNNTAATSKSKDIDISTTNQDQSSKDFRHNIFEEITFGINNLVGINPMFLDFDNGNFVPEPESPAHGYGDNTLYNQVSTTLLSNSTDLANNPRLFGSNIDLGAYEIQEVLSVAEVISSVKNISIYPNPTTNVLHISGEIEGVTDIEMFTVQGQRVSQKSISITDKTISLDLSYLSSGVYFLTISDSKNKQLYRIMKN